MHKQAHILQIIYASITNNVVRIFFKFLNYLNLHIDFFGGGGDIIKIQREGNMKNYLKTLRRYNGKYDHVKDEKWVNCILFVSEYFAEGMDANQPQAEKILAVLDSICENYLTISKVNATNHIMEVMIINQLVDTM